MTTPERGQLDRRRLLLGGGGALVGAYVGSGATAGRWGMAREGSPPAAPTAMGMNATIADLLRMAPQFPPLAAGTQPFLLYADLGAQYVAMNVPSPDLSGDWALDTIVGAYGLGLEDVAFAVGAPDEWSEVFGWHIRQVDQCVSIGPRDDPIVLVRGRFDEGMLRAAWASPRYRPIAVDAPAGAEAWDFEIAAESGTGTVQAFLLTLFDRVARLPSGDLIYARTEEGITRALATAGGQASAMIDQADLGTLHAVAEAPLVAAAVAPGRILSVQIADEISVILGGGTSEETETRLATIEAEKQRMPAASLVLAGITPGGPVPIWIPDNATPVPAAVSGIPDAEFRFVVLFEDAGDAAAAAGVIEDRLATGRSTEYNLGWGAVFGAWSVDISPVDAKVVLIRVQPHPQRLEALDVLYSSHDLGFLARRPDSAEAPG